MNIEKRSQAVKFLREYLNEEPTKMVRESDLVPFYIRLLGTNIPETPLVPLVPLFKRKFEEDKDWFVKGHHFSIGMGLRNLLRSNGFGERELEVENLDDYYIDILREALV